MISAANILPITTVKKNLMALLKKVHREASPLVITRDGRAEGILMSIEEYEGLMETLEILSDKQLVGSMKRAKKHFSKKQTYSHEQVFGA